MKKFTAMPIFSSENANKDILYRKILDVLTSNSDWYDDEFGDLFEDYAKYCAASIINSEDIDPETVDIKFIRDNLDTVETEIEIDSIPIRLIWEYEDPKHGIVIEEYEDAYDEEEEY